MVTLSAAWRSVGYDLAGTGLNLDRGQPVNFVSASERQAQEMIKDCLEHLRTLEELPEDVERMVPVARKHGLPLQPEILREMADAVERRKPPNSGHVFARRRKVVGNGRLIASVSAERIELTNGVEITAFAANPRTMRGFRGHVILDEFGAMPHADKIWAAASPIAEANLGQRSGFSLEVIGTPLGDDNMFYQLAKTEAGRDFSRHRIDVWQAQAQGFPIDIERARRRCGLEEIFQQEYGCAFLSAHSRYLEPELIDNATYTNDSDLDEKILRTTWSATSGLDVANSPHGDPSALVRNYKLLDILWAHHNITVGRGVSFPTQEAWVQGEIDAGVWRVCVDASGMGLDMGQRLEARYPGRVEGVVFTSQVKEEMATRCKRLLQQGKQRLPANQDLRRDLLNMRRVISSSANTRFDVARDKTGHGDRAWALMLSQHAAESGPPSFTPQAQWRR